MLLSVKHLEAGGVLVGETSRELRAWSTKLAFQLTLSLWLIRASVERDAELGDRVAAPAKCGQMKEEGYKTSQKMLAATH